MKANKLLKTNAVLERSGLCRSSWYNILNPNSPYFDPLAPKPIKITKRRIGWLEAEVDAWIASKAAQREVA